MISPSPSQPIDLLSEPEASELTRRYREVRSQSMTLCNPLAAEDYRVQSMPDVSPPWWNLGHTTWIFAKNILEPRSAYSFPSSGYEYALNSYYETHGERVPRDQRGLLSRPSTDEILALRQDVDEGMESLLEGQIPRDLAFLVEAGIQHEQQHQELLVTEIKHIWSVNPVDLRPTYAAATPFHQRDPEPLAFLEQAAGPVEVGCRTKTWCWDNELPVHQRLLQPFAIANRLTTVGEFQAFIEDQGYQRPLLWLASGWQQNQQNGWQAPLYWRRDGANWSVWTLNGQRSLDPGEPVAHVSFHEAVAFAAWLGEQSKEFEGVRLLTEFEWEHAANSAQPSPRDANFVEEKLFHPRPAWGGDSCQQLYGDLWEWTSSHYEPYPGYREFGGDLMEYNGKFMDNQRVLRGGSCATPRDHIRLSYRNFWPADTRFQFTGIRLGMDLVG